MNHVKLDFRANTYDRMRCLRGDSRGSLIVITALLFPVLLAFLGLALDVGMIYDVKRRQQKAADAGAMGGGHELWRLNNTYGEVSRAAKDDTARNGFDNARGTTTVTVTYPFNGNEQVEVVIEEQVPTYFARILGPEAVTVRSRAVSGLVGYGDGCIFVMDPNARDAFKISGNADLRSECGVYINSDHPDAAGVQGGTSCLDVPEIGLVGGMNYEGGSQECTSDYYGLMARVADPLMNTLQPPNLNDGLTARDAVSSSEGDVLTLDPGIYPDITITGGTVTLNPGLYVIDGGLMPGGGNFTVNGGTVDGTSGVTFYLTNTSGDDSRWPVINIAGNGQTPCPGDDLCDGGGGGGGGFGSLKTNAFDPVGTSAAANGTVAAQGGPPGGGGGGGGGGEGLVNLVAPSSASLTVEGITGMLFFYDRNAPLGPPTISNKIVGDSCSTFEGGLYFPKTDLAFRGTSNSDSWQLVVANTMEVMGTTCAYNSFEGTFAGMPPVRTVTLME